MTKCLQVKKPVSCVDFLVEEGGFIFYPFGGQSRADSMLSLIRGVCSWIS